MLKKVEQEAADKLDTALFEQNPAKKIPGIPTTGFQVFFSEMEEDFIEVLKKGITFSLGGVVRKVM